MKGLMAIMGLIFAILFGLVLYTHYDTKKFIQNLPQSPTMKGEVEKIPSPRDIEILQNAAEHTVEDTVTVLENPNDFHEHSDFHEHKHPDDSLVDSTPFLESNVTPHMVETLEETMIEVQRSAGWVPWRKVGPDGETIVLDRDAVIAEFGNTPKVNAYLEAQEETGKNNTDVTAEDEVSKAFLDKVIRVHNQQRDSAPRPTGSQASGVLRGQWQSET